MLNIRRQPLYLLFIFGVNPSFLCYAANVVSTYY